MKFSTFFAQLSVAGLLATAGISAADFTPGTLVAHWPLDETSGTVATDASGNANNGNLRERRSLFPEVAGPSIVTTGPTINAVMKNGTQFDGTNDLLVVDDSASLDFDKTQGSISFWLNTDLNRRAILLTETDGTPEGPWIEQTGSTHGNRVFFYPNIKQGSYYMVDRAPTAGVWEHYVCTWDYTQSDSGVAATPNRVKIYVNGVLYNNRTAGGGSGDSAFTQVPGSGRWVWGSRVFDDPTSQRWLAGGLAEIAVYDKSLSLAEVGDIYTNGVNTLEASLVSYWDFSEGPGSTSIADDSASGNTMRTSEPVIDYYTMTSPGWSTASETGVPTYISRALQFDGVNDTIIVPDSSSLDFNKDQGTISFWGYFPSTPRFGMIGDSDGEIVVQVSSSNRMAFEPNAALSNNLYLVASPNTIPSATWSHWAFVFDRTQGTSGSTILPAKAQVYRNGVLVGSTNGTAYNIDTNWTAAAVTADWVIGRRHLLADTANPRWFSGKLADVAIFSAPLNATDIQAIYDDGIAVFAAPPDTDKPTSSASITADAQVGSTINVDFTADDGAGSGIASTELFVKTPTSGSFVSSTLTQVGTSGTFVYTAADGNGLYQFYTVATDNSSNVEDAPASEDDEIAVSLTENTPVTLPFDATKTTRTFPMESGIIVTVTFGSVGTAGDLTVDREEGNTAPAGYIADFLIGQQIVITVPGSLAGTGITISFDYDEALFGSFLASENDISIVLADDGGVVTTYSPGAVVVDTVNNTITISGVSGFSTWYAGNSATTVGEWTLLDE